MNQKYAVEVRWEGSICAIDSDDGCLGYLAPPRATLKVSVSADQQIWGVSVDGSKNVVLKKDLALEAREPVAGKIYSAKIQIKRANPYLDSGAARGICHTEYPDNNLRLLELDGARGTVHEVALVSQDGVFFLTRQKTWRFDLFREDGRVVCPYFCEEAHPWPQMGRLIHSIFPADQIDRLAPADQYVPAEQSKEHLQEYQGKVLWYNLAQGIGAVETTQGSARVHWTQAPPRPRFHYLVPGETIVFQRLRELKETKLRRTKYLFEVEGVLLP